VTRRDNITRRLLRLKDAAACLSGSPGTRRIIQRDDVPVIRPTESELSEKMTCETAWFSAPAQSMSCGLCWWLLSSAQAQGALSSTPRQSPNGLPALTIRDLPRARLRDRPDSIILGKLRGGGSRSPPISEFATFHQPFNRPRHFREAPLGYFTSCVLQGGVDLLNVVTQLERRDPVRRSGARCSAIAIAMAFDGIHYSGDSQSKP
jgi:hypothetical protein